MNTRFLLYGANGFVGQEIAAQALRLGLQPVAAGRDAAKIEALAARLGIEPQVFSLDDARALDRALETSVPNEVFETLLEQLGGDT